MVDIKNYIEEQIGKGITLEEHINSICQLEKTRLFKKFIGKYVIYDYNETIVFYGKIKNLYFYEGLDTDVEVILENGERFVMYYDDITTEENIDLIIFDTEEEMLLYKEVEGL